MSGPFGEKEGPVSEVRIGELSEANIREAQRHLRKASLGTSSRLHRAGEGRIVHELPKDVDS